MTAESELRRRKDGSIDTAYYMAKGREARSAQAHQMGKSMWQRLTGPLKNLISAPKAPESARKPCAKSLILRPLALIRG